MSDPVIPDPDQVIPEPVITEPVITEPVIPEPVIPEPVIPEPVITEPEPVITEPEPVITEPVITEPVITEPVITEPVITEPVITEPVITEPVITEPVITEPEPVIPTAPVYTPEEYIPSDPWRPGAYSIYKQPIMETSFDININTAQNSVCGFLCKFVDGSGNPIVIDSRNSTLQILSSIPGMPLPITNQGQLMPATAKTYYTYIQPYMNGIPTNPDMWSYYFGDASAQLTLRFAIQHTYPFDVFLYIHLFRRPTFSTPITTTPGFPSAMFGNYIKERIHAEYFMGIETQSPPYLLWMVSPTNPQ